MPQNYTYPGVYIEEISTLPASVVQVPTAIPAFIGVTMKTPGPLFHKITSLSEYQNLFEGDAITSDTPQGYLGISMRLFYANGGGVAYVCSIATNAADVTKDLFLSALTDLRNMSEPTLIAFPDAVLLADGQDQVIAAALMQCGELRNRFCIIDVPAADALSSDNRVTAFRQLVGDDDLAYGAAYGPWLEVLSASESDSMMIPSSGAIAGIYSQIDSTRGVWKAPANVSISGIVGLSQYINNAEQARLTIDPSGAGKSINAIRRFNGKGFLVWGARTLAGDDNEWQYVPVRRLFIMIEESIRLATAFVVFEPNDANTWIKVNAMIENFLVNLWRQGALAGAKPDQAFFVNCGLGTSMTTQDILDGRLIINVGVAAIRPSEFIVIRFSHKLQEL
jgi:phage tail sheath protein FI